MRVVLKYLLQLILIVHMVSSKEPLQNSNGILGIDVSLLDGYNIDWVKVAKAGIKYAILRTTTKNTEIDKVFQYNYENALANGLKVMGYHFSYSLTVEEAIAAADNWVEKLNGINFPIYLDLEWDNQGDLGKTAVTNIAVAFIKQMQSRGYEANIYSNTNWYRNYYYPEPWKELGCKFWIAAYGVNDGEYHEEKKPNVGEYIWQYTSRGKVDGIVGDGDVDMNMMFGDL